MSVEARRGCGYRKVGGTYLVSSGEGSPCDRLPIRLEVCPVCAHGFKQARGCPLCNDVNGIGKAGLIWIGEKFYSTPEEFMREGRELGFSRRVKAIPREFKIGLKMPGT